MKHVKIFFILLTVIFLVTQAFAGGVLDSNLQQLVQATPGPFEVIVTFNSRDDVSSMSSLGVSYHALTELPMAAAVLSGNQINEVVGWDNVTSVYHNAQLEYFNNEAGEITGTHFVHDNLGFTGDDVTILVIDSGADATHPDLEFGTKVIQNVKIVSDLGVTGTVLITEGVINTDNTSGHGTHVSGTAGGSGVLGANDPRRANYYDGAAPATDLVVIGAGEGLNILAALEAFNYALGNQSRYSIDIITNSWGNTNSAFDPANPINVASYEAYRRGMIVTFAAGNEGDSCPAGCDCENTMSSYSVSPWVIGVAAGDKSKNLACFSSRGEAGEIFEHPDLTAPGVSIISTRAVGTPVGALGWPINDTTDPNYLIYYHQISGTSMATPFVAGAVALMLEANPSLSPDQIEDILTSTAEPMPYAAHHVGAGYIDVQSAVQLAQSTVGDRVQFLTGGTEWSSQGFWNLSEENDTNLAYCGKWKSLSDGNASGGTYRRAVAKKGKPNPIMSATFFGTAIKIEFPKTPQGGVADVYIDGQYHDTISFFSNSTSWGNRWAISGLEREEHDLQLRVTNGKGYVDQIHVDGSLFPDNTQFVDQVLTYTGTFGPSVDPLSQTHTIQFQVSSDVVQIAAELSWDSVADLDLYLLDPNGNQVASAASLANPESFTHFVNASGIYTYEIVGFISVLTNYTLTNTLTTAQTPATSREPIILTTDDITVNAIPEEFALMQNYPNPFNPETKISYHLPHDGKVTLEVFDIRGREVLGLVNAAQPAGRHGVTFNAAHLPSGVYLYRLSVIGASGEHLTQAKRMVLLK